MYGMNPGTDVLSLQMEGALVTGKDGLYATAALDGNTGEVILKIVNAAGKRNDVRIDFDGLRRGKLVSGSCTYLQADDPKTVNTLEQEVVVPRMRPVQVADRFLHLELQPYSFGVYRLQIRQK